MIYFNNLELISQDSFESIVFSFSTRWCDWTWKSSTVLSGNLSEIRFELGIFSIEYWWITDSGFNFKSIFWSLDHIL